MTYPRQCIGYDGEIFEAALPPGVIFSRVYGEKGHTETAYSIISTIDGGYLITGQSNYGSCLIRKLDSFGEKEWEHVLGEVLREELQTTNGFFICWSGKQITADDYTVIGTGRNEWSTQGNSFLLRLGDDGTKKSTEEFHWKNGMTLQLDEEGNQIWLSMFGLLGKLVETSDNGYAVVGRIWENAPDDSLHLFKADTNGNYVWERNLCQDKKAEAEWEKKIVCSESNLWDAIQTQDGGWVFTGGNNPIWVIKTNPDGFIAWIKSYDAASSHAVIQTSDGGFLISGDQHQDGLLLKTDGSGNLQWSKTFGGDKYDTFTKMLLNLKDELIVIGTTESFGAGAENTWLLEIDLSKLE